MIRFFNRFFLSVNQTKFLPGYFSSAQPAPKLTTPVKWALLLTSPSLALKFKLMSIRVSLEFHKRYSHPYRRVDHQNLLDMCQQYHRHQRKCVSLDSNVSLLFGSFSDKFWSQQSSILQIAIARVVECVDCPCSHHPIQWQYSRFLNKWWRWSHRNSKKGYKPAGNRLASLLRQAGWT